MEVEVEVERKKEEEAFVRGGVVFFSFSSFSSFSFFLFSLTCLYQSSNDCFCVVAKKDAERKRQGCEGEKNVSKKEGNGRRRASMGLPKEKKTSSCFASLCATNDEGKRTMAVGLASSLRAPGEKEQKEIG